MYINGFTGLENVSHLSQIFFAVSKPLPQKAQKPHKHWSSMPNVLHVSVWSSSNQTFAILPNCCSQESSRTLTCGSFHPDTLDSVLDGLPWYMCSLHWEYLEELNKVHSTCWNILYFFGRVDARSSGRMCFANLGESVLVSLSDQRVEGAPNNLPKMPDWSFS